MDATGTNGRRLVTLLLVLLVAAPAVAAAEQGGGAPAARPDAEALAKKLANPVAHLVSVPLQLNLDRGIGPARDGERLLLNVQPVIPFTLSPEWNLISRTILPVVDQRDVFPGSGHQTALGDTLQSLFLSPAAPAPGGIIWGAGPVLLLPTGGTALTSARKWGLGPTAVVLRQDGPWTLGGLVNHVWSVAGDAARPGISATYLQPVVSFTTGAATTLAVTAESTYDWKRQAWSIPLFVNASQVVPLGGHLFSVGAGVHGWARTTEGGPHGLGFRLTTTLLLPR